LEISLLDLSNPGASEIKRKKLHVLKLRGHLSSDTHGLCDLRDFALLKHGPVTMATVDLL
jgi:hypothetical protein